MNKKPPVKSAAPTDRMPPQAGEEEKAVLGSILIVRTALSKTIEKLDAGTLLKVQHQKIHQSAMAL